MVLIRNWLLSYGVDSAWVHSLSVAIMIAFISLICIIANIILKQGVVRFNTHIVSKNKFKWDDSLLALGENGPPLEIYAFSNNVRWTVYESVQADIFDHLFAVAKDFGLRIFQSPAGSDFKWMKDQ